MSERRLLILCYFYPPLAGGGVHRVLGFTRHLPLRGWACTVVCAGEEDYWVKDETLSARVPPGTEVIRVAGGSALSAWLKLARAPQGKRPGGTFAGLRRLSDWWLMPDSYAGWAARARRAAAGRIERGGISAVLSSSPPDSVHLAAAPLAHRFRLPWVADFRDPWIGLHFRTPPTAWHRARQAAAERRVLESADLVLTASRAHAETIGEHSGARPKRVEHLPNGFEQDPDPGSSIRAESSPVESFLLVFTGTLSLMPDVEVFLEALHDLLARRPEARRRLRAKLVGPYQTGYADRALALGLTGIVEFTGPLPHAETRALQRRADLLLLWKPRGAGYKTMVPGKLYEYLDAGRPVVALLDGDEEAGAMVRRAGGVCLAPGKREPLAGEIEQHYLRWKEGARPAPARPSWLAEHTRAHLSLRLAGWLDELTEGRS